MYAAMKAHGIELSVLTADRFEIERALRTLVRACRDPEDGRPAGSLEEWGKLDTDTINMCWQAYGDVRERLDPLGGSLDPAETELIELAVKKKDARLLRTFGIVKLSAWLASTDAPPSTSPTPSSSSSAS